MQYPPSVHAVSKERVGVGVRKNELLPNKRRVFFFIGGTKEWEEVGYVMGTNNTGNNITEMFKQRFGCVNVCNDLFILNAILFST